jgi:hypothetical protein
MVLKKLLRLNDKEKQRLLKVQRQFSNERCAEINFANNLDIINEDCTFAVFFDN